MGKTWAMWWKGATLATLPSEGARHAVTVEYADGRCEEGCCGTRTAEVVSPWTGRAVIMTESELPMSVVAKLPRVRSQYPSKAVWKGEVELTEHELWEMWATCVRAGRSAWR